MKRKRVAFASGLIMLGLVTQPGHAVQVNFHGGLVEALPCTISNGELIEVDFGDNLVIRNLDGVNYSKPVPYQIDCSAAGTVRMSIQGTATSFDDAAIQTNIPGLGIHMELSDGSPFYLNTFISQIPPVQAVPVADPAQPPNPGAFTARATLLAEYQ
ncbi:fimbrial protein [Citrobacter braakii]|nr:fimbrial protein [Citrobacter braakii]